jgi:hypothetical protein
MNLQVQSNVKNYGPFLPFCSHDCCAALLETQAKIPANLTTSHVGGYATVEGVVAEIFM